MPRDNVHRLMLELNSDETKALKDLVDAQGVTMAAAIRAAIKKDHKALLKAQVKREKAET